MYGECMLRGVTHIGIQIQTKTQAAAEEEVRKEGGKERFWDNSVRKKEGPTAAELFHCGRGREGDLQTDVHFRLNRGKYCRASF